MARTYSLVKVDGVLARDNVGDGRALGLAGLLLGGHLCDQNVRMVVQQFCAEGNI